MNGSTESGRGLWLWAAVVFAVIGPSLVGLSLMALNRPVTVPSACGTASGCVASAHECGGERQGR